MVKIQDKDDWDFFTGYTLAAAVELRRTLNLNEESYAKEVGFNQSSPRNYYLYGVLDQVIKTSSAMMRWKEFQSDGDIKNDKYNFLVNDIVQSVIDEQNMWRRKIIEILAELILFSDVNDNSYYKHYYLIHAIAEVKRVLSDWTEYYECEFDLYKDELRQLHEKLNNLENTGLDINKCWYLRSIKGERKVANFFQIYNKALMNATVHEKTALELTYQGYREASQYIHFTSEKPTEEIEMKSIKINFACIYAAINFIIFRCQELISVTPMGRNKIMRDYVEKDLFTNEALKPLFAQVFCIGDKVITSYGEFGEIQGIKQSKYGFYSYKVKHNKKLCLPNVYYSWYPGQYLRRTSGA